jgi:hypothetical protein
MEQGALLDWVRAAPRTGCRGHRSCVVRLLMSAAVVLMSAAVVRDGHRHVEHPMRAEQGRERGNATSRRIIPTANGRPDR